MKRLNGFSKFMSEVTGRGGILRTPNPKSRIPFFSRTPIHMVVILALILITTIGLTLQSHAQVSPGDTLVIDQNAGTDGLGALFRVNPTNGNRTLVSDFGNSAQGPLGKDPFGVALDTSGNILVTDPFVGMNTRGVLFRVNPTNGNRTILSDFGNSAQGPLGSFPHGVVVDASGSILVINSNAGTNSRGALFRVNPTNGNRTGVSDFNSSTQGPLGFDPSGVAIDSLGSILIIDQNAGTSGRGALFRVNPVNGSRTLVSDFGNNAQGTLGADPSGVALDALGNILIIDRAAGTSGRGALFRVNPNGSRTLVSDFGNSAQGALGYNPIGVSLDSSGNLLVIDYNVATNSDGVLFRVNPASGNRTVVSDFNNSAQGPLGADPSGVAIVPPQPRLGDILVIDPEAGANGNGALFIVDLFNGSRSLISNFGMSAQGTLGLSPFGVAIDSSGNILVIDYNGGTNSRGALFRVNTANGIRTTVSDFGNSAQGTLGDEPFGAALDASGNILVTDPFAGTSGRGLLFRVNPANGNRTVLSDFGNGTQGPLGFDPYGVAVDSSGNILVIDLDGGTNGRGALFKVNPSNGSRTIISDFGSSAQGTLGNNPTGVAIDPSGMVLVIDQTAGTNFRGALFRVNPSNGSRTLISDFGNSAQGMLGLSPFGVALGSSGMILVTDTEAGTNYSGALFGVNPSGGSRILMSDFGDPSKGILGVDPAGVIAFTLKCGGLNVTRIGNSLDNTINGTSGADVIHGLGGKDTINGQGGNDVICGGSGDDTLKGGVGNDKLFGDAGIDKLDGGDGTDTCNGGSQNDTATGCETRISIP